MPWKRLKQESCIADSSFRKMALQRDGEITGTEPENGHSDKKTIANVQERNYGWKGSGNGMGKSGEMEEYLTWCQWIRKRTDWGDYVSSSGGWGERKLWCWWSILRRQGEKRMRTFCSCLTLSYVNLWGYFSRIKAFNPFYFQINCDSSLSIIVQQPTKFWTIADKALFIQVLSSTQQVG